MCVRREALIHSEGQKDFSISDILCYEYAKLTCDVERTFPQYRSLSFDSRPV